MPKREKIRSKPLKPAGRRRESPPAHQLVAVCDYERAALERMSPAAKTYICSAAGDEISLRWNRDAYDRLLTSNAVIGAAFTNTHYQTSGALSVGWGDFTLVLAPKAGGERVSLSGHFSVITKKQGGKWVYVVDHASALPAPPSRR